MLIDQLCQALIRSIFYDEHLSVIRRICSTIGALEPPSLQDETETSQNALTGKAQPLFDGSSIISSPSSILSEAQNNNNQINTFQNTPSTSSRRALKFLKIENPFRIDHLASVFSLMGHEAANLSFTTIFRALQLNELYCIVDRRNLPLESHNPLIPFLITLLYIRLLKVTPSIGIQIYLSLIKADDHFGDYTWNGVNGKVKVKDVVFAIMDRRLRFGSSSSQAKLSKFDSWFNDLFEKGELDWIDIKTKAEVDLENQIFGTYRKQKRLQQEQIVGRTKSGDMPKKKTRSSEEQIQFSTPQMETLLDSFMDCFIRIRESIGKSDRIVLHNINFLLENRKHLHESIFNETNVGIMIELVTNYLEKKAYTHVHPSNTTPGENLKNRNATHKQLTAKRSPQDEQDPENQLQDQQQQPKNHDSKQQQTDSNFAKKSSGKSALFMDLEGLDGKIIDDLIIEGVLSIFSSWCKMGSRRWALPASAYFTKPSHDWSISPKLQESSLLPSHTFQKDYPLDSKSHSENEAIWQRQSGSSTDHSYLSWISKAVTAPPSPFPTTSSSTFAASKLRGLSTHLRTRYRRDHIKRLAVGVMNSHIVKLMAMNDISPSLLSQCVLHLGYSTIVLSPTDCDVPFHIVKHYFQYVSIASLSRREYLQMLDAFATMMRHLPNLDWILEICQLLLNAGNTRPSQDEARSAFHRIPIEVQHLAPSPLLHSSAQIIDPAYTSAFGSDTRQSTLRSSTADQKESASYDDVGKPATQLPSLTHQRDFFALFRMVSLWRRYDQGWNEYSDEETHALVLTIQLVFNGGPPPAKSLALSAAMGILDGLIQSKSIHNGNHLATFQIINHMFTKSVIQVAMNSPDIAPFCRDWRKEVAVIVCHFNHTFPNIDDTLLLKIVTDVFLEDSISLDYLFETDPAKLTPDSSSKLLQKMRSHKNSFVFRFNSIFSNSIASLFNSTHNQQVLDGVIFKLHLYCYRLLVHWAKFQPKYRAMSLKSFSEDENMSSKKSKLGSAGTIEKAAKHIMQKIHRALVKLISPIVDKLTYKQITRVIEFLNFVEFSNGSDSDNAILGDLGTLNLLSKVAAPVAISKSRGENNEDLEGLLDEEPPEVSIAAALDFAHLLEHLVVAFHRSRPQTNWVSSFIEFGIISVFLSKPSFENTLKLEKCNAYRLKHFFSVLMITIRLYPETFSRKLLEEGCFHLLFWCLHHRSKALNRKTHHVFFTMFMQPAMFSIESSYSSPPLQSQHNGSTSLSSQSSNGHSPVGADDKLGSHNGNTSAGELPGSFKPNNLMEEILPHYIKVSVEKYPEITRGESLQTGMYLLLSTLPAASPFLPFILTKLADRLVQIRLTKEAAELTRIFFGMIGVVPYSVLPNLLGLLFQYVASCSRRLQQFLSSRLLDIISGNMDYQRKDICTRWYLETVHQLGIRAKL